MKLYITPQGPSPEDKPVNGIQQVVNAQYRHLPGLGFSIVGRREAECVISHAGSAEGAQVTVAHCHGLYPTGLQDFPAAIHKVNERVIRDLRAAKAVIVPSQFVADLLRRDMHLEPHVIPHGLELGRWSERKEPPGEMLRILWNKNRDFDVCDPTPVGEVAKLLPEFQFLTTFGQQGGNVQVLGLQHFRRMKQMLYEVDLYLATTKETFGIATLEALIAGLPVVGYDWGATPEVVDSSCAILVPPGDVEALAVAVREATSSWGEMSKAAQSRAKQFPWDTAITAYAKVYREAVSPHQGPKITVVIPCYNYAARVGQAIQSVASQTFTDFECLVIDDGSTDNSWRVIQQVLKSMNDPRFRALTGPNIGVGGARNKGALLSRGEFLCFLDADDALEREYLQICASALDRDPSLHLVYTGLTTEIPRRRQQQKKRRTSQWPGSFDPAAQASRRNQVPTCNVMRKSVWEQVGGYRQRFHPAEDADFWLRAMSLGFQFSKITDRPLFIYAMHSDSASGAVRAGQVKEPDWLYDHPWTGGDGHVPFACTLLPGEHPVLNYDRPQVAIVIPVGPGHEALVLRALDSVEAQTYSDWECHVVDDTPHQSLVLPGRPWARIHRTGGGKGPAYGRNLGIRKSKAPWLLPLDADDFLSPTFLAETVKIAEPGFYVYTDRFDETGRAWAAGDFDEYILRHKALHTTTFLHERAAFEAVGGFDEKLDGWEDWDYTIAIAAAGYPGVRLAEPLVTYCTGAGSRRESSSEAIRTLLPEIQKKWEDVPMGCCGKRRQPRRAVPKRSSRAVASMAKSRSVSALKEVPEMQLVQVEYTGGNMGSVLIKCPSGNKYRYGGRKRVLKTTVEDAKHLILRPEFRLVEQAMVPGSFIAEPPSLSKLQAPDKAVAVPVEPAPEPVSEPVYTPVEVFPTDVQDFEPDLLAPNDVYIANLLQLRASARKALHDIGIYTIGQLAETGMGQKEIVALKGCGLASAQTLTDLAEKYRASEEVDTPTADDIFPGLQRVEVGD